MFKCAFSIIISMIIFSCTSPFTTNMGIKFKDREGVYTSDDKNIVVSITPTIESNLTIIITNTLLGIGLKDDYKINKNITSKYLILKSDIDPNYTYRLDFTDRDYMLISLKNSVSFKIANKNLKKIH